MVLLQIINYHFDYRFHVIRPYVFCTAKTLVKVVPTNTSKYQKLSMLDYIDASNFTKLIRRKKFNFVL